MIIQNDGVDPVVGTFIEGSLVSVGPAQFAINYLGGDGNDVTLIALNSVVAWTGAGDGVNWGDTANWSGNVLPGPGDNVYISDPGTPEIVVNIPNVTVNSLDSEESMRFNQGPFTVSTTASVDGLLTVGSANLVGGTWSSGTGITATGSSSNRFTDATITSSINLGSLHKLGIFGSTTFTTMTLTGDSAEVTFGDGVNITGDITSSGVGSGRTIALEPLANVTIDSGATITSEGNTSLGFALSTGTLTNNGTILANFADVGISGTTTGFTNNGLLWAEEATIELQFPPNNYNAGTLTGGQWRASGENAGRIAWNGGPATVSIIDADVELRSINSPGIAQGIESNLNSDALTALTTITANGSLTIGDFHSSRTNGTNLTVLGDLNVNSSFTVPQVTVGNGGTLSGAGTVDGPVTAQPGSTVRPGDYAGGFFGTTFSPGNEIRGFFVDDFDLQAGATLDLDIGGTVQESDYDILGVTGTVTLGGDLNLTATSQITSGNVYTIIQNDGADAVIGTFAGLAQGATVSTAAGDFTVSYIGGDGNDVTLTAVNNTFYVINTNDSGAGSLRQAIDWRTQRACTWTASQFQHPRRRPTHNSADHQPCQRSTKAVILDATTEPDFAGNPIVEIDGVNAGVDQYGLRISGGGTEIRGLIINNFSGPAMLVNSKQQYDRRQLDRIGRRWPYSSSKQDGRAESGRDSRHVIRKQLWWTQRCRHKCDQRKHRARHLLLCWRCCQQHRRRKHRRA